MGTMTVRSTSGLPEISMNKWIRLCLKGLLSGLALSSFLCVHAIKVYAQGFGVSGTLSNTHFKMVPGENFESKECTIIFMNTTSEAITVRIVTEAPEGLKFHDIKETYRISAQESLTIPISFSLKKSMIPGEYRISFGAQILPTEGSGIQVLGSAKLSAQLSVLGAAGTLKIQTVTLRGTPLETTLKLVRKEPDGTLSPISESTQGRLEERLVPGDYQVNAYYQNVLLDQASYQLEAKETLDETMIVRTVRIPLFLVEPPLQDERGNTRPSRIAYRIENLHDPLESMKLVMNVSLNSKVFETVDMLSFPYLDSLPQEGWYHYLPQNGWKSGDYGFQLSVLDANGLEHARSEERRFDLTIKNPEYYLFWGFIFFTLLIFMIMIVWLFIRRFHEFEDSEIS